MHPTDRLHDAARARAHELRLQAQREAWSALGRLLRRLWRRVARPAAARQRTYWST